MKQKKNVFYFLHKKPKEKLNADGKWFCRQGLPYLKGTEVFGSGKV